MAVVRHTGSSW